MLGLFLAGRFCIVRAAGCPAAYCEVLRCLKCPLKASPLAERILAFLYHHPNHAFNTSALGVRLGFDLAIASSRIGVPVKILCMHGYARKYRPTGHRGYYYFNSSCSYTPPPELDFLYFQNLQTGVTYKGAVELPFHIISKEDV